MKKVFIDEEVDYTDEYKFWKRITDRLIMDSPSARSDLIAEYLYDRYEMIIEEFSFRGHGPVNLRSVECPEITEMFLRLKYALMP